MASQLPHPIELDSSFADLGRAMAEPESSHQKRVFGVESSQAGADTVDRAQRIGVALTRSLGPRKRRWPETVHNILAARQKQ
jgi:hypothetical protein